MKSCAQAKSHFAPAPHICAYLRASRQGTFRKYLALPNTVPSTPAAPYRQNLFMENILPSGYHFVAKGVTALCLLRPYLPLTRLTGKGECAGATTVATARAEENRTQSLWRTLGFPSPHDFYQLPQPLAKKICFAKIFCEEEERAFSAYCPALPNSRVIRSVPTTSVRKETCEPFYSFPSDCGVTEKVLEMPSRA